MNCTKPFYKKSPTTGNYVPTPCGNKCTPCIKAKVSEWAFRLEIALKNSNTAIFPTYTYAPENLPTSEDYDNDGVVTYHATLRKKDLQLLQARIWKLNEKLYKLFPTNQPKKKIIYFSQGEYGTETFRPHFHQILLNTHPRMSEFLQEAWTYGHVEIGTVTPASIRYVASHLLNSFEQNLKPCQEPSFQLMSKKIGYEYIQDNKKFHQQNGAQYAMLNGKKLPLPKIFKEKIFSKWERDINGAKAIKFLETKNIEENKRLYDLGNIPETYRQHQIEQLEAKTKKLKKSRKL